MSVWGRCAICPHLCHSACPVALGSGRQAAVPSVLASLLLLSERGEVDDEVARRASTLCVDCGACQDHCHLDVPLPDLLRAYRASALPTPSTEPLRPLVGRGTTVAVESDEREWARALAEAIGEDVAVWRTGDDLGAAALHHPGFETRAARLRTLVGGRRVVVTSGGVAEVLAEAGIGFVWLRDVLPQLPGGAGSCRRAGGRPLACCGGAPPLVDHHPGDARRTGELWLERAHDWAVSDSRCRGHLRGCGAEVTDPVDALLAGAFAP